MDFVPTLIHGFFVGARIATLMTFAPFFGNAAISAQMKAALTMAITVLLLPAYASKVPAGIEANWMPALLGEMVIGLVMGMALYFVFDGIQLAGQMMGF